ncbi:MULTISPECIES: DNA/RNA non-specific endonuclease [unclassified Sphingomonas]|jgi:hypothetical protein|uniref:DNA/RNA non-specific endonuclease n=1 Tax=unclassified Sphingomonas TaxID=196159 RepID=UPI0009EA9F63|nr:MULTISPECIES: DNA/RNA non-specific endonuclease [unclassified Sphingomonas]
MSLSQKSAARKRFEIWVRTGVRLDDVARTIEVKFNPWHDPENGRFTFVSAGKYFPRGGSQPSWSDQPASSSQSRAKAPRPVLQRATQAPEQSAKPRKGTSDNRQKRGRFSGGGSVGYGGAGATGAWSATEAPREPTFDRLPYDSVVRGARATVSRSASGNATGASDEVFRVVLRNGYSFQVDKRDRTRRVTGALTVADTPMRSRTAQASAGGAERRQSDDGGHYIAARFNGPTDAFNHFAQDAGFNRGRYRLLEDEWAKEKRSGSIVTVRIVPRFNGVSARPSEIDVWWTVDGDEKSIKFPNERPGRNRRGR